MSTAVLPVYYGLNLTYQLTESPQKEFFYINGLNQICTKVTRLLQNINLLLQNISILISVMWPFQNLDCSKSYLKFNKLNISTISSALKNNFFYIGGLNPIRTKVMKSLCHGFISKMWTAVLPVWISLNSTFRLINRPKKQAFYLDGLNLIRTTFMK